MSSSHDDEDFVPNPTWERGTSSHIRRKLDTSQLVIKMVASDKYIVFSVLDRTIHVFTAAGEPHTIFRDWPHEATRTLALRADTLLSGELGGSIRCWDLATWYVLSTKALMRVRLKLTSCSHTQ